jgi:hypothetical protein
MGIEFIANPYCSFDPDLEFLGPGSSMLGGSDMIAAEMEEVVDRHCQLRQAWYASSVGSAVARCGEVLGTPIELTPSQPRGAEKLTSTPLS